MPDTPRNILIIKPSALGDTIQVLPALSALRRSFPDAEISWLIRREYAPLLEGHPDLTRVVPFDRKYLGKAWYNPRAFVQLLAFLRRLHHGRFDAVFDFQGLFRTAFFARVTCCKKRFGIANSRELAHLLYTHKVQQSPDCTHVVDCYMEILRAAGISDLRVHFQLPADPQAAAEVNELLADHRIEPHSYVVLVPGSAHRQKCWPAERFAALAARLSRDHGLAALATGSPSEIPLVQRLADVSEVPVLNLAGKTSIRQLVALLRSAALVVSNDTGPGHIAAALGRPLVMIFGRSNPTRVAPYGRKDCTAAIDPEDRGPALNSTDPRHAITNVTVDLVYEKVLVQLKQRA